MTLCQTQEGIAMSSPATLEEANAALRSAVESRLAGTLPDRVMPNPQTKNISAEVLYAAARETNDFIVRAAAELRRQRSDQNETEAGPRYTGDGVIRAGDLRPGSREFLNLLDEVGQLHLLKTLDYGVDEDALANIRQSADVINVPAWAGCILRISDKMHRLKAFFRRGRVEFDGVEDTLKDICSYAAIALVLYREKVAASKP